ATRAERSANSGPASKLEGRISTVVVTDADGFGDVVDEDFAVPNLPGARRGGQRFHHFLATGVLRHQLQLDFGQQVDVILLAPVDLPVALLPSVAAHVRDGHAVDADV